MQYLIFNKLKKPGNALFASLRVSNMFFSFFLLLDLTKPWQDPQPKFLIITMLEGWVKTWVSWQYPRYDLEPLVLPIWHGLKIGFQ